MTDAEINEAIPVGSTITSDGFYTRDGKLYARFQPPIPEVEPPEQPPIVPEVLLIVDEVSAGEITVE